MILTKLINPRHLFGRKLNYLDTKMRISVYPDSHTSIVVFKNQVVFLLINKTLVKNGVTHSCTDPYTVFWSHTLDWRKDEVI